MFVFAAGANTETGRAGKTTVVIISDDSQKCHYSLYN